MKKIIKLNKLYNKYFKAKRQSDNILFEIESFLNKEKFMSNENISEEEYEKIRDDIFKERKDTVNMFDVEKFPFTDENK